MKTMTTDKGTKTVWVTKYALTTGIFCAEVSFREGSKNVFKSLQMFVMGKEAFDTRPEAEEAARAQAKKKIAALQKKIAKIRELDFSE